MDHAIKDAFSTNQRIAAFSIHSFTPSLAVSHVPGMQGF